MRSSCVRFDSAVARDIFEALIARREPDSRVDCDECFFRGSRLVRVSLTVNGELQTVLTYPMERLLDIYDMTWD